jgi:hypothetical protein
MRTKLLSIEEVEDLLECPQRFALCQEPLLCTIVELVLLADAAKKGRTHLDWYEFLGRLKEVSSYLAVAALDASRLWESLFQRTDDYTVIGLWNALGGAELDPGVTVRRLILRSSPANWWEPELFDEIPIP